MELIVSIGGTIITLLLMALGYQFTKASEKLDMLLQVNGITGEKLKSHEEQLRMLQVKQLDNANEWKELYRAHNLNEIRHKN